MYEWNEALFIMFGLKWWVTYFWFGIVIAAELMNFNTHQRRIRTNTHTHTHIKHQRKIKTFFKKDVPLSSHMWEEHIINVCFINIYQKEKIWNEYAVYVCKIKPN